MGHTEIATYGRGDPAGGRGRGRDGERFRRSIATACRRGCPWLEPTRRPLRRVAPRSVGAPREGGREESELAGAGGPIYACRGSLESLRGRDPRGCRCAAGAGAGADSRRPGRSGTGAGSHHARAGMGPVSLASAQTADQGHLGKDLQPAGGGHALGPGPGTARNHTAHFLRHMAAHPAAAPHARRDAWCPPAVGVLAWACPGDLDRAAAFRGCELDTTRARRDQ